MNGRVKNVYRGFRPLCAAGILFLSVSLCGCGALAGFGRKELVSPYSFEEDGIALGDLLEDAAEEFSAAQTSHGTFLTESRDLCVVTDESVFAQDMIDAEAGILFDLENRQVLYSKNAYERLYPASITKIMTLLLAAKYGNLSDVVTVTDGAVITESGASLCGIHPGDQLTLEQLLYGLMLPSGNDAGAAIAIHLAGSIEAFADMMNEEARLLGATGTHFVNPHGLTDEEHYTTAYDLYLIYQEALKYPLFREVTGTVSYRTEFMQASGKPVTVLWESSNQYLNGKRKQPEGVTVFSGKTGTTMAAGSCLILGSRNDANGNEYISVVLKSPNRDSLYENMTKLISMIVK